MRRLHASGPRKDRPLVAINCAAIPRELIESELFGYEGGSFTGARAKGKPGKFVEADKGILFLDEIGDMAADLQATLLRVLDFNEVVPIGSSKPICVDVRVVAATNRGLQEMVQKGTFRRDLYYRLNGVQLWLPPLRERPDRLRLLAHLFHIEQDLLGVTEPMSFADEAWRVFFKHPWPGNIREARNVLRSSIAVAKGPVIQIDELPVDFLQELDLDTRRADDTGALSRSFRAPTIAGRRSISPIGRRAPCVSRSPPARAISPKRRAVSASRARLSTTRWRATDCRAIAASYPRGDAMGPDDRAFLEQMAASLDSSLRELEEEAARVSAELGEERVVELGAFYRRELEPVDLEEMRRSLDFDDRKLLSLWVRLERNRARRVAAGRKAMALDAGREDIDVTAYDKSKKI